MHRFRKAQQAKRREAHQLTLGRRARAPASTPSERREQFSPEQSERGHNRGESLSGFEIMQSDVKKKGKRRSKIIFGKSLQPEAQLIILCCSATVDCSAATRWKSAAAAAAAFVVRTQLQQTISRIIRTSTRVPPSPTFHFRTFVTSKVKLRWQDRPTAAFSRPQNANIV